MQLNSLLTPLPNSAHVVATPAVVRIFIEKELGAPTLIDLRAIAVSKPLLAHRPAEPICTQRHSIWIRRAHIPTAPTRVGIRKYVPLTSISHLAIAILHAAVTQQDPTLAALALGDREPILVLPARCPTAAAVARVGARDELLAAVLGHVVVAVGVAGLAFGSAAASGASWDGVGVSGALVFAPAAIFVAYEGVHLAAVGVSLVAVGVAGFAADGTAAAVRASRGAVGTARAGDAAVAAVVRVGSYVCPAQGVPSAVLHSVRAGGVDMICTEVHIHSQ